MDGLARWMGWGIGKEAAKVWKVLGCLDGWPVSSQRHLRTDTPNFTGVRLGARCSLDRRASKRQNATRINLVDVVMRTVLWQRTWVARGAHHAPRTHAGTRVWFRGNVAFGRCCLFDARVTCQERPYLRTWSARALVPKRLLLLAPPATLIR